MILGLEVALSLLGLYMLFTGRTWGKNKASHWQFRLLGGFLITLVPVMLLVGVIVGVVWMAGHPGATPERFATEMKWPITGIEFGLAVAYALIGIFWERMIRRKCDAAEPSMGSLGQFPG